MIKEELKNIPVSVSKECWKKLKIVSIQKDISLSQLVRDTLERYVTSKKMETIIEE